MISHAHLPSTWPCLRPCLPPASNLWLLLLFFQITWAAVGFIMATSTRGATMMIVEIDSLTFPLIPFIIRGNNRKIKVSQSPLEESRKRPGLGEQDSIKFSAVHEKIPHTDVCLPPYRIPHQCHQCSSSSSSSSSSSFISLFFTF